MAGKGAPAAGLNSHWPEPGLFLACTGPFPEPHCETYALQWEHGDESHLLTQDPPGPLVLHSQGEAAMEALGASACSPPTSS